ncbi:MAG: SlyX family protein [Planctomycetota bacterium]|nr:SlyX family protein [Planctomycetota bacterium]
MDSDDRIERLESVITHLQKQVFDLDSVVVLQQRVIDSLQRDVKRLAINSQSMQDSLYERRSPEEERPPHY